MAVLEILDLGRKAYAPTLELQRKLVERVKRGIGGKSEEKGYLVLVEHDPPVLTMGRGGGQKNVRAPRSELEARGFEVFETSRGGDVTYHGPGQIVGYPIVRVDLHGKDVHRFLRDIEEVIIRLLERFGVEGHRAEGLTGIWVEDRKIAAIGVALSRWVSYHGFALNVATDLSHFQTIVPCGIADKGVTSLSVELDRAVSVEEVKAPLVECFAEVFGFEATYGKPERFA